MKEKHSHDKQRNQKHIKMPMKLHTRTIKRQYRNAERKKSWRNNKEQWEIHQSTWHYETSTATQEQKNTFEFHDNEVVKEETKKVKYQSISIAEVHSQTEEWGIKCLSIAEGPSLTPSPTCINQKNNLSPPKWHTHQINAKIRQQGKARKSSTLFTEENSMLSEPLWCLKTNWQDSNAGGGWKAYVLQIKLRMQITQNRKWKTT